MGRYKTSGVMLQPRSCPCCKRSSPLAVFTHHFNRSELCKDCQIREFNLKRSPHRNTRALKLTPHEHRTIRAELSEKQGGKCMICGSENKLCLDHCHSSDKIRGLLCDPCNKGIDRMRDDPEVLERGALYLETADVRA